MAAADIVLDDLDIGKDRRPDLAGPASLRLYLPLSELVGLTKGAIRSSFPLNISSFSFFKIHNTTTELRVGYPEIFFVS